MILHSLSKVEWEEMEIKIIAGDYSCWKSTSVFNDLS